VVKTVKVMAFRFAVYGINLFNFYNIIKIKTMKKLTSILLLIAISFAGIAQNKQDKARILIPKYWCI